MGKKIFDNIQIVNIAIDTISTIAVAAVKLQRERLSLTSLHSEMSTSFCKIIPVSTRKNIRQCHNGTSGFYLKSK
ncbi:unnamed protein product [Tenebrio molitor]|nr:unnamed protein product [Tenebrio molitor]